MVDTLLPVKIKSAIVRKRGKSIIGPIDLELHGHGITMIMGPNGAGKTTLLRMMHGLERLADGEINWSCDTEVVRESQAFVFQSPIVLRRKVVDNIVYPLNLKGIAKTEAAETATAWLEKVGLQDRADLTAGFLSGGEKQKLALARALATNPQVLFLDEPTSNLDGTSTREIETIILHAKSAGIRVIMTTHDLGQASRLADEVLFLYRGRLHDRGSAAEFLSNPQSIEAKAFIRGDIVE